MEHVTAVDGVRLTVHTIGDGDAPPAIVVPGGPARGVEYLDDLAGLGADRRLVVLHPRGTPTTGGRSRGWWTDADDVVSVAGALGLAQVDLIAHSAGTRLALAVAARHPRLLSSLALVTPPSDWLSGVAHDGADLAARRGDPDVDAAWASLTGAEPADDAAFQRAWDSEAPAGYAAWTGIEQQHAGVGDMSLASVRAWFRDVPADAADRILAAARPRTLVVSGDGDLLTGVAPVRAAAAALGAELVELSGCGHYPWVERPTEFRAALADWLRR
ncbi:alpha/beta hydrolase [Schumannella luteola]|uniref:Pimeloyl-ACP methyl ester carboxylesterase n=1 Tax=Schumannella luteola TaxID=472059 RepID=A0A852YL81_9MICO|nr:alpha/beta hydrolase [Schumannella luteola]NYG99958.1 pimeloyl-ACP methyl ester carboxylesterase [Schumannella luteola]TPX05498.1 alpha/beta hydrolase [Schumannella luteola]